MTQNPAEELNKTAPESIFPETSIQPTAEEVPAKPESTTEQTEIAVSSTHETQPAGESIESLQTKLKNVKHRPALPQKKDTTTMQVEQIMEEGLADAYKAMTPTQQQEFKIKGEKTAFEIRELLRKTHVKVKKIFKLILEWLKLLPGINKFFLVQEAKIKADKIIALKNFDNMDK